MPTPTILERSYENGIIWYAVVVEFPTPFAARTAWDQIERRTPIGSLGIYRHGFAGENEGQIVSAVSLDKAEIRKVLRFLRAGHDYELPEKDLRALFLRRARVVLDAAGEGMESGRLKWRRPDNAGAQIDHETGDMIEPRRQG